MKSTPSLQSGSLSISAYCKTKVVDCGPAGRVRSSRLLRQGALRIASIAVCSAIVPGLVLQARTAIEPAGRASTVSYPALTMLVIGIARPIGFSRAKATTATRPICNIRTSMLAVCAPSHSTAPPPLIVRRSSPRTIRKPVPTIPMAVIIPMARMTAEADNAVQPL